jgi:hypothetical protein
LAAPPAYEDAVLSDSPYVYYRLGESSGTSAGDTAGARLGTYHGTPSYGVLGMGTGSDTAVGFDGTDNEFLSSSINSFGSLLGASSYEFAFRVNPGFNTGVIQSLFGVYTSGTGRPDINIDLNTDGNDTGGVVANTTRLFIRGNNGDATGGPAWAGHFTNAALYDGEYHHLVFTFDVSQGSGGAFRAYVDGIEQSVTFTQVNGTGAPTGFSDLDVPAAWGARNVRTTDLTAAGVTREANITLDEAALYGFVLSPGQVATHAASAIPEPASAGLLLAAGALMLVRRRRA